LYYNALSTGRPIGGSELMHLPQVADDKFVSRYIDEENTPQFPFGYGLSYTGYLYGQLDISKTQLSAKSLNEGLRASESSSNATMSVSTEITNIGTRAGEETVQLYLRLQGTSVAQPVRTLGGFQHIVLSPGQTKRVTFTLGPQAFASWNEQNNFTIEPARVTLWVSPDSSRGSEAILQITK
jgi:beta-glucosidase